MERGVHPGVDERFDLHRGRGKVCWEAAAMLSWQSVEMALERCGDFSKACIYTFRISEASVQTFWKWDWAGVTLLPGCQVHEWDGNGIAGHKRVAEN